MKRQELERIVRELYDSLPGNVITSETAIRESCVGLTMFEPPLVGCGSADDPLFDVFLLETVIGPCHKKPSEWLDGAKSVVSLFFPFSEAVRRSNRCSGLCSLEWLHGRIEGQAYMISFTKALAKALNEQGFRTCIPACDNRFFCVTGGKPSDGSPLQDPGIYRSNWSERHVAYLCGLGTFGLSKGLITEKGMAGRLSSLITDLPLEADTRPYAEPYAYCLHCGKCIPRCPVNAISLEKGKDHTLCGPHVDSTHRYGKYGCGLCQAGVPCEAENPTHAKPEA